MGIISNLFKKNKTSPGEEKEAIKETVELPKKKEVEKEKPNPTLLYKDHEPPIINNIDILREDKSKKENSRIIQEEIKKNIPILESTLKDYKVDGKVVEVHVGIAIIQYNVLLKSGTPIKNVESISKEIAGSLLSKKADIIGPLAKDIIGIVVPNRIKSDITLKECIKELPYSPNASKLLIPLGKSDNGTVIGVNIADAPHILMSGSTGTGKSVCLNSIICSILMYAKPDEVKFVLIDTKKVDFSCYNGLPHLLLPVVIDPKKGISVLYKVIDEIVHRYDLFEKLFVKDISSYNTHIGERNNKLDEKYRYPKLPYILVIIDDIADMNTVASKELEDVLYRITTMGRGAGVHIIVSSQLPKASYISTTIKVNTTTRIAFYNPAKTYSKNIIGIDDLDKLGVGEMYYFPRGEEIPLKVHGIYMRDDEIRNIVEYCCKQYGSSYDERFNLDKSSGGVFSNGVDVDNDDPLYNDAVEFVCKTKKVSASLLQRRFKIGYNRAANLVDKMEERGVVGPGQGSKPREVLVQLEE